MTAALRNIHFSKPVASPVAMPRERKVTNDPAREYAQRPGEVERLPDDLAACILSAKRMATVKRNQIIIEVDGEDYKFFHPDSITLRGFTGETRVPVVFDNHDLSCIHILTRDGEYVETLPRKGEAAFFDEAAGRRELAATRALISHVESRIEDIHKPDSRRAVESARHNLETIRNSLHTLPLKDAPTRTAPATEQTSRLAGAIDQAARAREARAGDLKQHLESRRARRVAAPAPVPAVQHSEYDW